MKVYNLTSPNGNPVPNQFAIVNGTAKYFQSYRSIIAKVENGRITLDSYFWDYSRTTAKYRNIFLGMSTDEIKKGIKSGSIALANLN